MMVLLRRDTYKFHILEHDINATFNGIMYLLTKSSDPGTSYLLMVVVLFFIAAYRYGHRDEN